VNITAQHMRACESYVRVLDTGAPASDAGGDALTESTGNCDCQSNADEGTRVGLCICDVSKQQKHSNGKTTILCKVSRVALLCVAFHYFFSLTN